jgi:predicted dehydrogenase
MYLFAIIGCGRIAERHAENIVRKGKLAAVCDIVPSKADALAQRYSTKAYYTIDELLKAEKDIQIVSICTPNGYHAEHCIKSLQAGKHVLCEKPMCITSAAAWQLIETEKFCRRKLFVVKSTRYNPLVQQLKSLIDSGDLGKIYSFQLNCFWNRPVAYYTDWRGKLFPDGGTLYTQFSHYIDAMLWLFGDVKDIKGFATNAAHGNAIEFEDTGVVALTMQSGVLGGVNWSVNTYQKNAEISFTLIAEKGTISLGGTYLNEIKYQHTESAFRFTTPGGTPNQYGFYNGSMSNHTEVYDQLIRALENEEDFVNAYDGLNTVETIEKIYKAVSTPLYKTA